MMLLIMALPQNVEFFTELIQNSVVIHQYFAITCSYLYKILFIYSRLRGGRELIYQSFGLLLQKCKCYFSSLIYGS